MIFNIFFIIYHRFSYLQSLLGFIQTSYMHSCHMFYFILYDAKAIHFRGDAIFLTYEQWISNIVSLMKEIISRLIKKIFVCNADINTSYIWLCWISFLQPIVATTNTILKWRIFIHACKDKTNAGKLTIKISASAFTPHAISTSSNIAWRQLGS